jgi:hypothetical protein
LGKWALRSEAEARIKAMVALAESESGVPVVPAELDTDRWLLTVLNGTINLHTGQLGPHRREDLITKLAPVMYDRQSRSDLWESFLARMLPNPDLRAFVQRAIGYSCTGDTREETLFFPHGPTATGKSKHGHDPLYVCAMEGQHAVALCPFLPHSVRILRVSISEDIHELPSRRLSRSLADVSYVAQVSCVLSGDDTRRACSLARRDGGR